jgi:hypothetical protein
MIFLGGVLDKFSNLLLPGAERRSPKPYFWYNDEGSEYSPDRPLQ